MNKKSFSIGLIVGGLLGIIPGFGLGVYFLPIIIADEGADEIVISQAMDAAERRGVFKAICRGAIVCTMAMATSFNQWKTAKPF